MFFSRKNEKNIVNDDIKEQSKDNELLKIQKKQIYQNIISNKIDDQAEDALEATELLLKSIEDINIAMEQHSEHINNTAYVSNEVGAFSEEVSASVNETMRFMDETLNKAELGQKSVDNVVSSIGVVKETVEQMQNSISELVEKSNKIKGIVSTIKGIASTTHLLSLNANIEAARAGESGRGFAVVAGEVKKLAQNSSQSADEISNIISEITSVTNKTLNIIVDGMKKTTVSLEVAENAGQAIEDIVKSVEETKNISNEINIAIKEQADKNQYMISVIEDLVKIAENVKAFNENMSINAVSQKAALNILKETISNLKELASIDKSSKNESKTTLTLVSGIPKSMDASISWTSIENNTLLPLNIGLFRFGKGSDVVSAIAKSWNVEEDNVTWDFVLRKDVKFHNGRTITAKDVKFSFERLLSKELDSPNRWFIDIVKGADDYYNGRSNEVKGILVTGEYNLKIILEFPYSSFVNNLAYLSCGILPKEEISTIDTKPIGAGPYKFVHYDKENEILTYEKIDNYPLGEGLVDKIVFLNNNTNMTERFLNGEIDYIPVEPENIEILKQHGYKIETVECMGVRMLPFNFKSRNPLVTNKEARQAINYCIDKDEFVRVVTGNLETPSTGSFPSAISKNNSKVYSKNLNKARELLRNSGVKGNTLTFLAVKDDTLHNKIAQFLTKNLKEIGINLKVNVINTGDDDEVNAVIKSGNCDIFEYRWFADSGTADNFIEPLININNSSNSASYDNSILMECLNLAKKTKNPYKYREIINKLEKEMIQDSPWIFLSNICKSYACSKNVKGFNLHPLNIILLDNVWKE